MQNMPTESQIQKSILEWLRWHKFFVWRNNSGMQVLPGKDKYYVVRQGIKGSSDIIGILPGGQFLAIEVKRPGNKPTPDQDAFMEKINTLGGVAFVAYSIDDVEKKLKKYADYQTKRN